MFDFFSLKAFKTCLFAFQILQWGVAAAALTIKTFSAMEGVATMIIDATLLVPEKPMSRELLEKLERGENMKSVMRG